MMNGMNYMNREREPEVLQEINIVVYDDGTIKLHSFGEKPERGMKMAMKDKEYILDFAREAIEEVGELVKGN